MIIPIIVLLAVFTLIAVRHLGRIRLQIWQVMAMGALAVLLTGQISPLDALRAINLDVMLYLFGMFVVEQALEESGYLALLSYKLFKRAQSVDHLVLFILFGFGIASAFLMNDTIAIMGTPIVLHLVAGNNQNKKNIKPQLLLLTLAFGVTIGSVMSPIGNPQNLLIAINSGIPEPFITFLKFLMMPTMVNLLLAYFILKLFYGDQFNRSISIEVVEHVRDSRLALLSKISLILIAILMLAEIAIVFLELNIEFKLTYIALIPALVILIFSPTRLRILWKMDWYTLIFFAAMFILMESVWRTGFFQSIFSMIGLDITSTLAILTVSVLLSQLISNVPLVALYMPVLLQEGASTKDLITLAAGSTIAGNLSILGAASNVIIIQNAEREAGETITFQEFVRIGAPLTMVNIMVYWIFLSII